MRILNFSKLNIEESILLNKIAEDIRKPFNDMVSTLYKGKENNIDWFLSSVASRDIYLSPLFLNCCFLALIIKLIELKKIPDKIIVNSKAMQKVLRNYLKQNGLYIDVEYPVNLRSIIKDKAIPLLRWGWNCLYYTYQYLKIKKIAKFNYDNLENITILDTFILPNSFSEDNYIDRYYFNLLDFITNSERKSIYYLPTFYQIKDYFQIILGMKNSKEQFLLKEYFLTLKDYCYAFGHYWRIFKIKIDLCSFLGFDITDLIKEEIYCYSSNSSTLIGFLNYRFVQRLKEHGVNVRLVIDWFENQVVDRGLNAGFRKYYPQTSILGYVGGSYLNNNIHLLPIPIEEVSMVIPKQIAVMGEGMIEQTREFDPNLDVIKAPAFRFQHVWDMHYHHVSNQFTVLVALPIILSDGNEILELIKNVLDKINTTSYRFLIKPHPTNSIKTIEKAFEQEWPKGLEFISRDFYDCLEQSNLLITKGSSTCMETLARGIPVIIIGSKSGLTQNPIPLNIKDDIWVLCYTEEELLKAICFYANRDEETINRHEQTGKKIKELYFEPTTREGVYRFLQLES